jgi:putative transcriptional regulator
MDGHCYTNPASRATVGRRIPGLRPSPAWGQHPAIAQAGAGRLLMVDDAVEEGVAGKLLVAMPGIGDPRFKHAVILMCVHDADQAMGVVINKPRDEITLGDVLEHLGIDPARPVAPLPVLDGGPVRPDRGFVLHSDDFAVEDATQAVAPGVCLTTSREVLEAVGGTGAPERFVLALGCSGWGAGQLEEELRGGSWLVVEPDDGIVYGEVHDGKWQMAIAKLGLDPVQLGATTGRA